MQYLFLKAFGDLLAEILIIGALLFIPAGTINYWQAWTFLAVFSIATLAVTIYLMQYDPMLLERRVKAGPQAEKQKSQKIIQFLAYVAFMLVMVVPSIDHRLSWSVVTVGISIFGDVPVAAGLLIVFFVFRSSTFTSGTIEVEKEQKIITSGSYAIVRHPMYTGAIIMLIGVPLALGSLWGLLAVALMAMVIIFRLLNEERFLTKNLIGYAEYQNKIKYRILPFVW
jgi:protein-S-isoprenylcysteine O-methyltransferase Ste14